MFNGRILLIDHYTAMNALIDNYLTSLDYEVICSTDIGDITERQLFSATTILLDIDTAGGELCGFLLKAANMGIPTIVMTSQRNYSGRLEALELGAADVVSRPLELAELAARIRSVSTKIRPDNLSVNLPKLEYSGLTVNLVTCCAEVDGEEIGISPKEMLLLYLFLQNPNRVFSREEISRRIGTSSTRTINGYVNSLKKHIGRYAENIVPIRGVGYKFKGEAENEAAQHK